MNKKYLHRFLSLVVSLIMLSSVCSVSAFYEPGDISFSLGTIELSAGTTNYEFYLPFDTGSMTYTVQSGEAVSLSTGQQTVTLDDSGTLTFSQVERKGARIWEFYSETAVTLSDVVVNQYNYSALTNNLGTQAASCALSENEMAISTALLVDRNASCIIVSGARRYIDYENPDETPAIIDGSMYLPGRTLALALGCYYESIPGKNYVLIRESEQGREFYFTAGYCYEQTELGEKIAIPFHPVYKDGEVFLPVRCFAELLGKTVEYRDGIAIIDDYYSVQKMLTEGVLSYIKGLFEEFAPTKETGRTYHVAQTSLASDNNSGTQASPFRTIARAADVAEAGDTVIIHKGIYRDDVLKPQHNGTATNPIVFRAAEGEEVILSATKEVTGFTSYNGDLLQAPVPADLGEGRNQVFYNNECIIEARYPNGPGIEMSENGEKLSDLFPVWADMQVQDRTAEEREAGIATVLSDTLFQETEPDYWKGAAYLSVHGYSYALMSAKVTASEKGKLTLANTDDLYWRYNPSLNPTWNFGYISGHINAIDQPGEWVVKDGMLIIKPPAGETANSLKVEMKTSQVTIDLSDREFVQVIGIKTFGGGAKLNDSEMCVISDVDMKYVSHYTYSVDQREGYIEDYSDAARKSKNGAPQRGEMGVYISGKDNAFINSRIDHSAAAGLYLAGLYAYVDNNIISNCGYMGSYVCGITAYPEPWTEFTAPRGGFAIYNNTVYNAGRHPFKIQSNEGIWTSSKAPFLPFEVAYNDFHDGNLFTLDTGMAYAYCLSCSTSKARSRIHSNYMYSTTPESNPYSFGLYFDGGSMGIDGYNNVIFTTEPNARFTHSYVYASSANSSCTYTNNATIKQPVTGGAKALEVQHFPKGKPFYAGQLQNREPFLKNYERLDETYKWYDVKNATLSGNYVLHNDGGVSLPDTESVICFENVDFSGGINQLDLYFGGDRYLGGTVMRVVVAESLDAADKYEFVLRTYADELYETDMQSVYVGEIEGTKNVYITTRKAASNIRIYGMSPSGDGKAPHAPYDSANISAADYDYIQQIDNSSAGYTRVTQTNGGLKYVMNTRQGTTLVYKNVTLKEAANYLKIAVSQQDSGTAKRYVSFYADSLDSEDLIISYQNADTLWIDATDKYAQLPKTLPAGTYDIYVKFTGGNSSNFFSFGFLPEVPAE